MLTGCGLTVRIELTRSQYDEIERKERLRQTGTLRDYECMEGYQLGKSPAICL